jgi:Rrf2 family transcriptional regulator, iron-sulfur cluster assembly transcription factor
LKITAQEEYGLRCLLQLARQDQETASEGTLLVRDIAEREGLSVAYVEKILWMLGRSGLVESVRGPKGGHKLARPATAISLGEVMRVLGGIQSEEELCGQFTGQHETCVHHGDCGLKPVWTSITDFVNSVFDKIPLSTLLSGGLDVRFVQISTPNRASSKLPTALPVTALR